MSRSKGGRPRKEDQPEGYEILMIAERYGTLPSVVEAELDEWWFNRILTYMHGETLADKE